MVTVIVIGICQIAILITAAFYAGMIYERYQWNQLIKTKRLA